VAVEVLADHVCVTAVRFGICCRATQHFAEEGCDVCGMMVAHVGKDLAE
jgi:hypothetical protein